MERGRGSEIPITAKPPYPQGNWGKWQQGAGVESENKRRTEYNLPGKLAVKRRKALPRALCSPRAGAQRAFPFLQVPLPDRCLGALSPLPQFLAVVTATASGKPSANPGANNTGAGRGCGGRRRHSGRRGFIAAPSALPPTSLGCPRSYLLSASPGKTTASLSLPAGPRTSTAAAAGRASRGSRGLPGSPSRSSGRRGNKTAASRPAQRPPPAPPHGSPTAEATAATQSPARGAMVAPALAPLRAPSLHPPLQLLPLGLLPPPPGHSSPPPPPRPLRALLPSPRGEGGGGQHSQSPLRLSNQGWLFIPGRAPPAP
ncbi:vegetative cell wall protein gp1-like [Leopardus geoffroyi]|uniref:vegetative cell wall protein gp1-like n=1 Tax=Leopardus geoffroyi TaxID=46844 RepID=UPI001E25EC1C|nr:vegetative cell wall protein gp1-like [Leopardus geoffroyi]